MNKAFLIIASLFFALQVIGQTAIKVIESAKDMSQGMQPAFVVNIPETEIRDVERDWKRQLQKGTRSRVEQDKEEMKLAGAKIVGVPGENVTLYSRLYADKEQTLLVAFIAIDSVFFTPGQNADMARSIRDYLRDFAIEEYREVVKDQVRDEERKLQLLERSLKALRDEQKKNEQNKKESEREIRNLQDEIAVNLSDQDRKSEEIEKQKDMVAAVKDFEEEHKAAKKELKSLERDKKKLQRQRESMHKRIDRLESEIKRDERDIRIGKEKQRLQEKEVKEQEAVVKSYKTKLESIS